PGMLDQDLARPPGRDAVEHPDALSNQVFLDGEVGVTLGHDPDLPARAIGAAPRWPVGRDLGRGEAFVAGTEGAGPPVPGQGLVGGAAPQPPLPRRGVLAQPPAPRLFVQAPPASRKLNIIGKIANHAPGCQTTPAGVRSTEGRTP